MKAIFTLRNARIAVGILTMLTVLFALNLGLWCAAGYPGLHK